MRDYTRLQGVVPYLLVLVVAGYLYYLAVESPYDAGPGRLGPYAWPKGILYVAFVTCIYAIIVKCLSFTTLDKAAAADVPGMPSAEKPLSEEKSPTYPRLLVGGILLTVAYVTFLETVGYFFCTALYTALLIYIGRYRNLWAIAASSVIGTLVLMFVFMKVVYVSLPIGREPFAMVMLSLMHWMGIK